MSKSIRKQQEFPSQQAAGLNTKVVYDIPLTADLERLLILLSGTVTTSVAATALVKDGIAELIQSVDLIANGSDTIASLPFAQLVNGNMFRRYARNAPPVVQPTLAIGVLPFSASGVLDLSAFGAIRPKDSSVRETKYKTLQLILRFAPDFTSVMSGATVTGSTINSLVTAHETVELPDPTTGKVTSPILRPLISYREDNVTGATIRQRFRLTPEQALRGLVLRAVNGAGNATTDATLSQVRVYTGTTLRYAKSAAGIRADNQNDMQAAIPTGYYFLNFAAQGQSPDRLNDSYDLRMAVMGGADAYLEYDSSAAMTLGVAQWGNQQVVG